ncbi:MAG: VOC family protein [Spirochaetales bacterium]|jgi:lactoylglutathione lyase
MKFCWTTINVTNMEKSLGFYRDIVGLPIARRMKPNPDMEIVFLGSGETQVELIYEAKNKTVSFGRDISIGFVVESLDAFAELLKSAGVQVFAGPFQPNPSVKFIYLLDPDGLRVQFVQNMM